MGADPASPVQRIRAPQTRCDALDSREDIVYGYHPVCEVLRHRPQAVRAIWCSASGRRVRSLRELAASAGVGIEPVSSAELDRLLQERLGQAVAAAVHNGFALALDTAEPVASEVGAGTGGDRELIVLLEDIQDPRNLGAILRVCEGAGVGRVLVRDRGSAPLSAIAIKASAGAAEWVPVERYTNSAQELERLKQQGYWCYGADAEGQPPWAFDLTGPVVLCVGGEGGGLRRRTLELCDGMIGLPMRGRVTSLNVATATSALLYEALRQRLAASKAGS